MAKWRHLFFFLWIYFDLYNFSSFPLSGFSKVCTGNSGHHRTYLRNFHFGLLYMMTVLEIDRIGHYPRLIICIGTITMENPLPAVFLSFCHYFACLGLCRKVNKISVTQKKLLPLLNYQTMTRKSNTSHEQPLIINSAKEKEVCLEMDETSLQLVCSWAQSMTSANNGCYETTAHKMATNNFNQLNG